SNRWTTILGPGFFRLVRYSDLRRLTGSGGLLGGVTPAASITRWKAATVGEDGLKFRPGRWPAVITTGDKPLLFGRFPTSILAPLSAKSCTTLGRTRDARRRRPAPTGRRTYDSSPLPVYARRAATSVLPCSTTHSR